MKINFQFICLICIMHFASSCSRRGEEEYEAKKEAHQISMYIMSYVLKYGKLPESVYTESKDYEYQFPQRWKDAGDAVDPWGRPYKYKYAKENKSLIVWSSGKNKTDENGAGDDIVYITFDLRDIEKLNR